MNWKEYLDSIVEPLPKRFDYILNGLTCFVAGAAFGIVAIIGWPEHATKIGGTTVFLLFFGVLSFFMWKNR